jgi:hypothetical protein
LAWTVSTGALPHGLSLTTSTTNTVTVSGTPDTGTQDAAFTIQVADTVHQTATQPFTVSIAANSGPEAWYAPDGDTPDYLDLFRHPDQWKQARSQTSVFQFGPQQVMGKNKTGLNTSMDLGSVQAFNLLRSWGIKTAIEVPAIKEWDCTGELATKRTLEYVSIVRQGGGSVDILAVDEALVSGVQSCHYDVGGVAQRVAAYFSRIRAGEPSVAIGITEAYPRFSADQIEQFITGLEGGGARPAFFHIDVNIPALPLHPEVHPEQDLLALQGFFRQHDIPFGVIVWSGYNPTPSDRAFYESSIAWARRVHAAIGAPDQIVFESWVTRSSQYCSEGQTDCTRETPQCTSVDPPYCGKGSVPLNLPENNLYTFTRLLTDGLSVFE